MRAVHRLVAAVALAAACAAVADAAVVFSTYPREGVSPGGAATVTVFGDGFPNALDAYLGTGETTVDATVGVSIGGTNCPVIATQSTDQRLVCGPVPPLNATLVDATPKYLRTLPASSAVELLVTGAGGLTIATSTFSYLPAMAPVISEITHAVLATGTMTITGSVRTSDPLMLDVTVGPAGRCDTAITTGSFTGQSATRRFGTSVGVVGHMNRQCALRLVEAGIYNASLQVNNAAGQGIAGAAEYGRPIVDPSAVRAVFKLGDDGLTSHTTQVFATVTSVTPSAISPTGTLLTITGTGFAAHLEDNEVQVGAYPCRIESVTATRITCRTPAATLPNVAEQSLLSGAGWLHNVSISAGNLSSSVAATGSFSPLDLPIAQARGNWTAAVAIADLEGRGTDTPTIGTASGVFTPRRTGAHRFWCTATDFVSFRIGTVTVCNATHMAPNAPVLRYFRTNSTVRTINTTASEADGTTAYSWVPVMPRSVVINLNAGQAYDAAIAYGLGSRASYYSVAMSVEIPYSDEPGGLPFVSNTTVGSYINFTIPKTNSFVIALGSATTVEQVRVPAVPLGQPCAAVSVASIMEATFYRFRASQSVVESPDGAACSWLVHLTSPHSLPNITAEGDELVMDALHAADPATSEQELWYDPVPARLLGTAFRRTAPPMTVTYIPPAPSASGAPVPTATALNATNTTTNASTTTGAPTTTTAASNGTTTTGAPVVNGTGAPTATTIAPAPTAPPLALTMPVRVFVRHELAYHGAYASTAVVVQSAGIVRLNITAMNLTQSLSDSKSTFTIVGESFFNGTRASPVVHLIKSGVDNKYWCRNVTVDPADARRVTCGVFSTLPGGLYEIKVDVGPHGWAIAPIARFAVRHFTIATVSPASGSWYGGAIVTVAGANFPDDPTEAQLVVGDARATILALSPSQIVAQVNPMTTAVPAAGRRVVSVQLSVVQLVVANNTNTSAMGLNGTAMAAEPDAVPGTTAAARNAGVFANHTVLAATPQGFSAPIFTMTTFGVPTVASVTPAVGSGATRAVLTVTGTNLLNAHIRLCTESCEACDVVQANATGLTCRLPFLQAFTYDVVAVERSGLGRSAPNAALAYTSVLSVATTTPAIGSPFGGTRITITGAGFTRDVRVRIGAVMQCPITRVTPDTIECTTAIVHANPLYVPGYTTDQSEPIVVYVADGPTAVCTTAASASCGTLQLKFGGMQLPSIAAVTPLSGQSQLLTLTGVNFVGTETIQAAGAECNVTRRSVDDARDSVSTVYCQLPADAAAATGKVNAVSAPYGIVPSTRTYTLAMSVRGVTPSRGSVAGGHLITVSGTGFPIDAQAFVGGQRCQVGPLYRGTSQNLSHIVCETSALPSLATLDGVITVTSARAAASATCTCTYTYDTGITPIVTRVTPLTGQEGTEVNISGSRVTLERPEFTVAGVPLPNATLGELQWTVRIGRLPGVRAPIMLRYRLGYAWVSAQEFAVYPFITGINPRWSSYNGGQNITITGSNFRGTAGDTIRVTVCGHECPVTASTHSAITCVSPPRANPTAYAARPALERQAYQSRLAATPYLEVPQAASANVIDGDATTSYNMTRSLGISLAVGLDLGDQVYARIANVRYATPPMRHHELDGATIEASIDAIAWTTLAHISDPQPGWNSLAVDSANVVARYVRIKAADTSNNFGLAEMELEGAVSGREGGQACPVVVYISRAGYAPVSTCTERPSRCLAQPDVLEYIDSFSPSIAQVDPYVATVGSPAQVTVFGATFGIVRSNVRGVAAGAEMQVQEVFDSQVVGIVPSPLFNERPTRLAVPLMPFGSSSTELVVSGKGRTSLSTQPLVFSERWSSPVSWRGASIPTEGANVVIPAGRTITLDVSPPQLGTLYIYGTLIAARRALTLRATSIVVDNGGSFLVGTSIAAHSHGLDLILGGVASTGMTPPPLPPVFGRGTLGVRRGTVKLYGARNSPTYATLSTPAGVGNTSVTLSSFASWAAGSVIAITSPHHRDQWETRVVTGSFTVGRSTTFTFDKPLQYYHEGTTEVVGQLSVTIAAQVMLLSRSVRVYADPEWAHETGAGAVVHAAAAESNTLHVLLDNIEMHSCGQPARASGTGAERACVHFSGDADLVESGATSIVIHSAFAGGFALDGVRRVALTTSTVFNVRGHGVALLSGTTRQNSVTSLVIAVTQRNGASAQHPACVYLTHPTNDLNAIIAGGCEFAGFWFDLAPAVVGRALCPQRAPFGRFQRNTAYANGKYGLYIPKHTAPTVECADPAVVGTTTTIITGLEVFNNGVANAHFGSVGNYAVVGSAFLDAGRSGVVIEEIEFGSVELRTSYFVARSSTSVITPVDPARGVDGISAPGSEGLSVANCSFTAYNDNSFGTISALTGTIETVVPTFAFRTCAMCDGVPGFEELGGFTYVFSGLQFTQSPNRVFYAAPYVDIALDLDGSLLGRATGQNYTAVPRHAHIADLPGCLEPPVLAIILSAGGGPVVICDDSYRFHRVLLARPAPALLATDQIAISSSFGTHTTAYRTSARYPERSGFMVVVPTGTARDEIGAALYDVSTLNFTIATASGNDWSAVTVYVDPVQQLYGGRLPLRMTYVADLARVDAVGLRFDAMQRALPIADDDTVIPTYYADPEVIGPTITQPATHMYLETSAQRITLISTATALEAVEFSRILCAATGCIKMQPPVVPPRSFSWTDTRAWADGIIPGNNADVVIPPGMTITLGGNTSVLRSLIIQGELVLHPRLASEIIASYIVVFGGTLRSQANHGPQAKITLRSDINTAPLGVEEGRVLQPGSMLVFGTLSLTGTARTHQWLPLSETLAAGSSLVKTSDAVADWQRQDVLVVTPSLRDWTQVDELVVNDFEAGSTTFRDVRTVNSATYLHQASPVDLSSGQRLSLNAKVAVITRNIVVDAGAFRRGHQITFGEYGRDLAFAGQGTLDSVQIRHGGFNATANATVVFDGIRRRTVTLSKSSVHDNYGTAVRLVNGATGVTVADSILYKTVGPALDAGTGGGSRFLRNLAVGVAFPPEIIADPSIPYALCAYDSRFSVNTFTGNVAAGSASEGFCVQLPACSDLTAAVVFSANEAHSCTNGFYLTETTAPEAPLDPAVAQAREENPALATMAATTRRCVQMHGSVAWSNAYMGVYSAVNTDLRISGALIHDNHIGLYPGTVGEAIVTVEQTVIAGRSKPLSNLECVEFRCRMDSINGYCNERHQELGDGPNFLEGEIGLLLATLSNRSRPANYSRSPTAGDLPLTWPRRDEPPSSDSAVALSNVVFANFLYGSELGLCDGGKAIVSEGYSLNTVVPHSFMNITWVETNTLGSIYLHTPAPQWAAPAMCEGMVCDALNHVALRDLDGTLVSLPGRKATVYSRYYLGALIGCTVIEAWNAYQCDDASYAQLRITNGDSDARTRSISPLEVQDERFLARINAIQQPPMCYRRDCTDVDAERPGSITGDVRTERVYLVDFSTEVPRRSRWELRHCMAEPGSTTPSRALIVRVQMPGSMDVRIWANGRYVPPSSESVTFRSEAGANYFEALDSRQYMVLPCDAVVEAHQLVHAIVTMRLAIVIEQYVASLAAQFVPRMARLLALPESQIDVLEVYPGSTVVRFRVVASDSADYNPSEQARSVNSRVLRLLTTPLDVLAEQLQMPVANVDDIQWAEAVAPRPRPPGFSATFTDEFIIAVSVSAAVVFLLLIVGAVRLRSSILAHRDVRRELPEGVPEHELRGLTADDAGEGASGFVAPGEDEAAPRVEVGIKSLKIKVDVSDDEEDSPAAAAIGTRSGNTASLAPPSGGAGAGGGGGGVLGARGKYWAPADDEDDE